MPTPPLEGNVTYVSMLVRNPADPNPPLKRIEWLLPLLHAKLPLILYADPYYQEILGQQPHPLKVVPLDICGTEMYQHCMAAPVRRLPARRTPEKDTEFFMILMSLKTELVARATRDGLVTTPFVAFLDASIAKVLKAPLHTLEGLRTLTISPGLGLTGPLLPGCQNPQATSVYTKELLQNQICWMFCGGFFLVEATRALAWHVTCRECMLEFLGEGSLTWEVNLWAWIAQRWRGYITWFAADHNDSMLQVPSWARAEVAPQN